jgi:hypothetical protein
VRTELIPELQRRLADLCEEGWQIWDRFSSEAPDNHFHPFVPADYETVLEALLPHRTPGLAFLEWGSANGVIAIMADLLGFRSCGIELDRSLVESAQALAARYDSNARFVTGSFLPEGYVWRPHGGDDRLGTIGQGSSGYLQLGRHLDEFDLVFAFPWGGEEPIMLDLMRAYGRSDALLLLNTVDDGVRVYQGGRLLPKDPHDLPAR